MDRLCQVYIALKCITYVSSLAHTLDHIENYLLAALARHIQFNKTGNCDTVWLWIWTSNH